LEKTMTSRRWLAAAAAAAALNGCSGGWWPFGSSDAEQPVRLPEGVVEYACAQGKRLLVRYTPDAKSAWVIYPDREFRLDRVGGGPGDRYSNGVSTLVSSEDTVTLDSEGSAQFVDCRRTGKQ